MYEWFPVAHVHTVAQGVEDDLSKDRRLRQDPLRRLLLRFRLGRVFRNGLTLDGDLRDVRLSLTVGRSVF